MKKSLAEAINLMQRFRLNRMLIRYLKILFIVLILPVLALNLFIYSSTMSNLDKEIATFARQNCLTVSNTLNNYMSGFHNDYLMYNDDYNVSKYLSAELSEVTSVDFFRTLSNIRSVMDIQIQSSPYVDSIYIYSFKSKYVLSNKHGNPIDNFNDRTWLECYKKNQKDSFIAPVNKSNNCISVCYELMEENRPVGILVFNFNMQYFKRLVFSNEDTAAILSVLYNENHEPLYSAGQDLDISKFVENNFSKDGIRIKIDKKHIHTLTRLNNPEIALEMSFFAPEMYMRKIRAVLWLILSMLISLIIILILSVYLSFKFYESISKIVFQITDSGYEDLEISEKGRKPFDESELIGQNISKAIKNYSNFEDELYKKIANLKRMQLLTLQSQLSPHFLFNTLNHVNVLTMNAGENGELANQIICDLSEILNMALRSKKYIIDIKTEIYYAEKYIEIEKIKHQNSFDVVWNIEEDILNCATVTFILQPIIENALSHGIHKVKAIRRGILDISAKADGKNIIFTISDNGIGMDEAKLKEVLSQLKLNDLPNSEHIGLCNVHQRIKLIFGDAYGITEIVSDDNGTKISITIPKHNM